MVTKGPKIKQKIIKMWVMTIPKNIHIYSPFELQRKCLCSINQVNQSKLHSKHVFKWHVSSFNTCLLNTSSMSGAQLLWEDSSHLDGGTSKHRSSALVSQGEGDCLSLAQAKRMNATVRFFHKLMLNKSSPYLIILQRLHLSHAHEPFEARVCV